jgi:peptide/nickel transport system substrate-binding protein
MLDRTTKLRWRRRFRRRRKQVETFGEQAEQQLEVHVIGRLGRLWRVRRFLLSWFLLVILLASLLVVQTRSLSHYFQRPTAIPGGSYTEGILGTFTTANPLYAQGPVDSAVARLVFSGLFKFDDHNQLVGDLAQSWTANDRGNIYTVELKPNLRWQDGVPLTSADVVYTYQTIQQPDAQSPLLSSWQGVTVTAVNSQTVTFTLPQALSSFPYHMTNGIVPKHILSSHSANQLRTISFDTVNPVGAGPFSWKAIQVVGDTANSREERIALVPNPNYVGGAPKLDSFIIRAFHSQQAAVASFNHKELDGMSGFDQVPKTILEHMAVRQYSFPLTAQTMVFLKTSGGLLADVKLRQALVTGTDNRAIADSLGYPVQVVDEPFLRSQAEFNMELKQAAYNPSLAQQMLDAAGWLKGSNGVRQKDGQQLTFNLVTEDTQEYIKVSDQLKKQWQAIGVNLSVTLQSANDLQTALAFHTYDALLYGISVGVDPDVFAYWDSSQADIRSANRLNFSEYKSSAADRSLEAGRTRSDSVLRTLKYKPFLEAWQKDAPAIGLYQPRSLYFSRQSVAGLTEHTINSPVDRYSNVQNWMIRQADKDIN